LAAVRKQLRLRLVEQVVVVKAAAVIELDREIASPRSKCYDVAHRWMQHGSRSKGWSMAFKSPILAMFLKSFKAAAGEGAALELKMRLLAGKIPALQSYTHQRNRRSGA
jgi:hypothetical protein